MITAVIIGCSLVFGSASLFILYRKIMKDLDRRRQEWELVKQSWEEVVSINEVLM